MSSFDKHVLAFFPTHIRFGPIQRLQSIRKKSISDTLLDENDESLVFMTIWYCRTNVRMTSMTSSVKRTDLDFKISVVLFCTGQSHGNSSLVSSLGQSTTCICLWESQIMFVDGLVVSQVFCFLPNHLIVLA